MSVEAMSLSEDAYHAHSEDARLVYAGLIGSASGLANINSFLVHSESVEMTY
jgi:hypothetical protein